MDEIKRSSYATVVVLTFLYALYGLEGKGEGMRWDNFSENSASESLSISSKKYIFEGFILFNAILNAIEQHFNSYPDNILIGNLSRNECSE